MDGCFAGPGQRRLHAGAGGAALLRRDDARGGPRRRPRVLRQRLRPRRLRARRARRHARGAADQDRRQRRPSLEPRRHRRVRAGVDPRAVGPRPFASSCWQRLPGADSLRRRAGRGRVDLGRVRSRVATTRRRARRLAGRGLAVLTPRFTSPTQALQLQALLRRFPQARWHRHSPLAPGAARDGCRLAFGRELDAVLHLDRARCVVALDADPFSDGPGQVRQARDWAAQRAGIGDGERTRARDAPRSFAIESSPGLFGARADERVAMAPAQIEVLVDEIVALVVGPANADASVAAGATAGSSASSDAGTASLLIAGQAPVGTHPRPDRDAAPATRCLGPHARRHRAARRRRGPGARDLCRPWSKTSTPGTSTPCSSSAATQPTTRRERVAFAAALRRVPVQRPSQPRSQRDLAPGDAGICRRRTTTKAGAMRAATTAR